MGITLRRGDSSPTSESSRSISNAKTHDELLDAATSVTHQNSGLTSPSRDKEGDANFDCKTHRDRFSHLSEGLSGTAHSGGDVLFATKPIHDEESWKEAPTGSFATAVEPVPKYSGKWLLGYGPRIQAHPARSMMWKTLPKEEDAHIELGCLDQVGRLNVFRFTAGKGKEITREDWDMLVAPIRWEILRTRPTPPRARLPPPPPSSIPLPPRLPTAAPFDHLLELLSSLHLMMGTQSLPLTKKESEAHQWFRKAEGSRSPDIVKSTSVTFGIC